MALQHAELPRIEVEQRMRISDSISDACMRKHFEMLPM